MNVPLLFTNPDTRMKYVCGFLFDHSGKSVALIRKKYPPWQAGMMNGVGGRIKAGESPEEAMTREFSEEAKIAISNWKHFCTLYNMDAVIHWFVARIDYTIERDEDCATSAFYVKSPEPVFWCRVDYLDGLDLIPNTRWLIVMAMLGPDGVQGNVWPYNIWEPSRPYTGSSQG